MKKFAAKKKKRIFFFGICLLLLIASVVCILSSAAYTRRLDSQHAAKRWQGDSEQSFAQVSCFIPVGSEIGVDSIYTFRYAMIKALEDASLDVSGDTALWNDAWSCSGTVNVSGALGKGEAAVIAVGGDYFNFHPVRLVSGSYISPQDLMQDRVLLDRELAWLLFGSAEVQGLSFDIEGNSFVVAGVVEREEDPVSEKAYKAGRGLYMSFETYLKLRENAGVSCYEFIMAEPVAGYARSTAESSFPVKRAEVVDNSQRFSTLNAVKIALNPFERSMQTDGIVYPYWENAARYTESVCGSLLLWAAGFMLLPAGTVLWYAVKYIRRGRAKLNDELIPEAKENISEAIRRRQRKRWEKYHGKH